MQTRKRKLFVVLLVGLTFFLGWLSPVRLSARAQQPTGSIPTVTGTPEGPYITVTDPDGANVRSGPSSFDYPVVIGFLVPGETAPAIGRSPGQEWIQIKYLGVPLGVGWVYAPLVSLSPGYLPIVEPPPTATPRVTPTINPTYAAAFEVAVTSTRLPTFTAPPPFATLDFSTSTATRSKFPMGFVILGLAVVGILGAAISFIRGR